jgi:glycosyltransferase involved in cell wall biosynthesis
MGSREIFIFTNTYFLLTIYRENLILSLAEKYQVTIIGKFDGYEKLLIDKGIKCINFEVKKSYNPFYKLYEIWGFWRLLSSNKVEFLLTFSSSGLVFGALLALFKKNLKLIINVTGRGNLLDDTFGGRFLVRVLRILVQKKHIVFYQNENDRSILSFRSRNYDNNLLMGSGIDLKTVTHKIKNYNTIKILFAARMEEKKGLETLIGAFNAFRPINKCFELWVAGDIEQASDIAFAKRIKKAIKANNNIKHLGWVRDMTPIFQDTNVSVLPSQYNEGLSNFLIKSIAYGNIVIASDRAGCREVIEPFPNENGFLLNNNTEQEIVSMFEKIDQYSHEKLERLSRASRRHSLKFSDEKIIRAYHAEIEKY